MADGISKDEMRDLFKEFFGSGGGGGTGGISDEERDAKAKAKASADFIKNLDKQSKALQESFTKTSAFNSIISGTKRQYADITESLKQLDEQIAESTDDAAADALRSKKIELEKLAAANNSKTTMLNFGIGLAKLTGTVLNAAAGATGTFVRGLQDGSSSTQLASGLMNASVDMMSAAGQTAGAGLSTLGQVVGTSTNPKLKILGGAAQIAGVALSGFASGAGKLAKFGIEILSKEVEKTVKAFNDATTSGALFANGMTGLRAAASDAGLDVQQFASVLKTHSADIASLGMGVSEGSKKIGATLKAGGAEMKTQLLNLGYSFEEQAGLAAETMQQMRGSGGPLRASNAEVAAETMKYASNLRIISAITGEDAKKKQAQAAEQNQILAFQQKLAGKSETQRAQINAAMATMTEQEKKNFRDRVVLGQVINKEGAIYEATIDGARAKGEAAAALFNDNNLTAETNAQLNAQYGEQIKASALAQTDLAIAAQVAGGALTGVATAGLDAINQANKYTAEAFDAAKKARDEQSKTQDPLTKDLMSAAVAAQDLRLALQDELTPAIRDFAAVSKAMLTSVRDMLKDVGIGKLDKDGNPSEGIWDKGKRIAGGAMTGGLAGLAAGSAIGTVAGGIAGGVGGGVAGFGVGAIPGIAAGSAAGGAIGSGVGAVLGGLTGAIKEAFWGEPGKAQGGIASGPTGGFMEKLHGTEAVVPLPDGKTIPVTLAGLPSSSPSSSNESLKSITDIFGKSAGSTGILGSAVSTQLSDLLNKISLSTSGTALEKAAPGPDGLQELLSQQIAIMKETLEHTTEMLSAMNDSKNYQQQLLNNSY